MLKPEWLRTFKTLIDCGHFTQTAEQLHMTQPGVSQHLRKLEAACGQPLIAREHKRFEITDAGQRVYRYACELGQREHHLLDSLRFDDPHTGLCRLACSGSLALRLYGPLLQWQQPHAGLLLQLEAAPEQRILEQLLQGEVDLGVVTEPPGSLFECQPLGSEALCLIMPRALEGASLSAEQLSTCGLIDHPDAEHYLSLYLQDCGDEALAQLNIDTLPRQGYINQIGQILLPVAQGLGFTVLPASALAAFEQPEKLWCHNPQQPVSQTLYLAQKRHRPLASRYELMAAELQKLLD